MSTGPIFYYVPQDVWRSMAETLESDDDLTFTALCVNREMSAILCDNEEFWEFACDRRGWNTPERNEWTKKQLKTSFTHKQHYRTWRGLVHNNESIREAVKSIFVSGGTTKPHLKYGHITIWDTSKVTDMSRLFYDRCLFDEDIGKWDTSKVTEMSEMFLKAESFDKDISKWDTSNVKRMIAMFCVSKKFNGNISKWVTSSVTNMRYMFSRAESFNQDISGWDTSSVVSMERMFKRATAFSYKERITDKWELQSRGATVNTVEMF